jgi:hypothetical protein
MLLIRFIIFNLLLINILNHLPKDKNIFILPVKIPVSLSSNFGEMRIDHFHSGIDIKTQGVIGKEVVSSAEGYIYRIGVSPSGFGKALYVKHPSGYSTVYGHLDHFTPEVEAYVRAVQYERKSFNVTLFPPKEKFPVSQGDVIAWSGDSGSSGGPHLHFEVREADNELPVNPLLFEFGITDNIPPVIEKLAIYSPGKKTSVYGNSSKMIINLKGSNGKYVISDDKELVLSGPTGFGVKVYDLLNGASNRCEPYSITLEIDSTILYKYNMDGFSFAESRYVNSHMDYETYMKDNIRIERAFALPNDKLTAYKTLLNRGIFNFNDNKSHNISITVSDANQNKSTLVFKVISGAEKPEVPTPLSFNPSPKDGSIMMPYNKTNRFSAEDIIVNLPAGSLYDTLLFTYRKSPGTPVMLSDVHSVHNKYTPVHRAYSLSIRPTIIPAGRESKMILVQLNDNMSKIPVISTFADGFMKGDVLSFGNFFVGIDTIPPSISAPGLNSGINLTGRKEIRLKIKDDFSGIKSYEAAIDGKWALFEYDPKSDLLLYRFDEKYITKASKHSLSLKVSDNRDNVSSYSCDFTW